VQELCKLFVYYVGVSKINCRERKIMNAKKMMSAALAALLLAAGCAAPAEKADESSQKQEETEQKEPEGTEETAVTGTKLEAPEDDVELYKAVRAMGPYLAAYESESMGQLQNYFIMNFDLNPTINENLSLFANPDEETKKKIEELRNLYNNTYQIKTHEEATFDIWEGHEKLPVPGTEIDPSGTAQACLADDPGFRPVINDWRLEDPSKAVGTLIAVPSVRASSAEELDFARIFNAMGYNVFGVEYRFNQIEEAGGFIMLALDTQRAVRYIKYHAKDLGIDADKITVIGGSKGNGVHMMTTSFFDVTPTEYCESLGLKLDSYEEDEIDAVPANTAVSIFSYGNAGVVDRETGEFTLDDKGLYSEENFAKGLKLPAMMFLSGTQDFAGHSLPAVTEQLYAFNDREDKLYPIDWEVHIYNAVPHGFGTGAAFENVTKGWEEVDKFIQSVTNK